MQNDIKMTVSAVDENATKTLKELKDEIKKLKEELDNTIIGSKKFKDISAQLAIKQKQLSSAINKTTKSRKKLDDRMRISTAGIKRTIGAIRNEILVFMFVVNGIKKSMQTLLNAKEIAKNGVEYRSKFKQVFKDLSQETEKWVGNTGKALGRSQQDLIKWMATLQDTFVPLGFARKKSQELSKELVKSAIDVASFNNKLDADVIRDYTSALVGNHETVRKYGIIISEASMQQEAMRMGINKTFKNLTDLEKVQIRYNIILNSSKDAQGDVIRTSNSLANIEKRRKAIYTDMMEVLGQKVVPIFKAYNNALIAINEHLSKRMEIPIEQKIRSEQYEFEGLIKSLQDTNISEETRNALIQELQTKYSDYLKNVNLETAGYDELSRALFNANVQFETLIKQRTLEKELGGLQKQAIETQTEINEKTREYHKLLALVDKANDLQINKGWETLSVQQSKKDLIVDFLKSVGVETAGLTENTFQVLNESLKLFADKSKENAGDLSEDIKTLQKQLTILKEKYKNLNTELSIIKPITAKSEAGSEGTSTSSTPLYDKTSGKTLVKDLKRINSEIEKTKSKIAGLNFTDSFERAKAEITEEITLRLNAVQTEIAALEEKKAKKIALTEDEIKALSTLKTEEIKLEELKNLKILEINKEYQQKLIADKQALLDETHQQELAKKLEHLQEMYDMENEVLQTQFVNGLLTQDEFERAKAELSEQYRLQEAEAMRAHWAKQHEFMNTFLTGFEGYIDTMIDGMIDGTMTIKKAQKALEKMVVSSFATIIKEFIKQQLIKFLFSKGMAAKEVATAKVTATGIAASWAPAAAAVGTATMGGASASAGIAYSALLATITGLNAARKGMFVDQEQLVRVGEDGTKEVIIPVDKFPAFIAGNYKLPGGYSINNMPNMNTSAYNTQFSGTNVVNNRRIINNTSFDSGNIVAAMMKNAEINARILGFFEEGGNDKLIATVPIIRTDNDKTEITKVSGEGNDILGEF